MPANRSTHRQYHTVVRTTACRLATAGGGAHAGRQARTGIHTQACVRSGRPGVSRGRRGTSQVEARRLQRCWIRWGGPSLGHRKLRLRGSWCRDRQVCVGDCCPQGAEGCGWGPGGRAADRLGRMRGVQGRILETGEQHGKAARVSGAGRQAHLNSGPGPAQCLAKDIHWAGPVSSCLLSLVPSVFI